MMKVQPPDGIAELEALVANAKPNATITLPADWMRKLLEYVRWIERKKKWSPGRAAGKVEGSYGRLTVIKRAGSDGRHAMWLCQCTCKTMKRVAGTSLRRGKALSCGCLRKEELSKRARRNLEKLNSSSRYPEFLAADTLAHSDAIGALGISFA